MTLTSAPLDFVARLGSPLRNVPDSSRMCQRSSKHSLGCNVHVFGHTLSVKAHAWASGFPDIAKFTTQCLLTFSLIAFALISTAVTWKLTRFRWGAVSLLVSEQNKTEHVHMYPIGCSCWSDNSIPMCIFHTQHMANSNSLRFAQPHQPILHSACLVEALVG